MAIVLFPMNELIRSSVVSSALASVGERPVIFASGECWPSNLLQFPSRRVPQLSVAADEVRKRAASELYSTAAISLPSVLVEDTHPAPIDLPPGIRRVLLVGPASFEYLVHLNQCYRDQFSVFLVCDSPDSPTWPYDENQTRRLAGWKNWHVIGPLYHRASEDAVRQVRTRLKLGDDRDICVFSMGRGDNIEAREQDYVRFLSLATQIADVIEASGSHPRLLFVDGAGSSRQVPIPARFEAVPEEDDLPALLKIARGAVTLADFNTCWDCITAGTPFLPLPRATGSEPAPQRINRLQALGMIPPDVESFWFEGKWRAKYRHIVKTAVAKHSGAPEPGKLRHLILGPREPRWATPFKPRAIRRSTPKSPIPLVIRIDDVVREERALCWLLELLAARRLPASLEVIPYLQQFDDAFLRRFDPSGALFEVSQHGYAHITHTTESGQHYEFLPESAAPTPEEVRRIGRGKQQLEAAFPDRFTGGFSSPFDATPPWLPVTWHSLGGTFVSCVSTNTFPNAPLPVRWAGMDVWNWRTDRALDQQLVRFNLKLQYILDGHAGLVLHPHCFRSRSAKLFLRQLLDNLQGSVHAVSLRDLALGKIVPLRRTGRLINSGHRLMEHDQR